MSQRLSEEDVERVAGAVSRRILRIVLIAILLIVGLPILLSMLFYVRMLFYVARSVGPVG